MGRRTWHLERPDGSHPLAAAYPTGDTASTPSMTFSRGELLARRRLGSSFATAIASLKSSRLLERDRGPRCSMGSWRSPGIMGHAAHRQMTVWSCCLHKPHNSSLAGGLETRVTPRTANLLRVNAEPENSASSVASRSRSRAASRRSGLNDSIAHQDSASHALP